MSEIKTESQRLAGLTTPYMDATQVINVLRAEIAELRAFIGDLPEAQNELLKINNANMAEIARLEGEMYELRNRLEMVLQDASIMAAVGKRLDAENTRLKELLVQALGALKFAKSVIGHPDDAGNKSIYDAIIAIEKEGIK